MLCHLHFWVFLLLASKMQIVWMNDDATAVFSMHDLHSVNVPHTLHDFLICCEWILFSNLLCITLNVLTLSVVKFLKSYGHCQQCFLNHLFFGLHDPFSLGHSGSTKLPLLLMATSESFIFGLMLLTNSCINLFGGFSKMTHPVACF